jgi:hypothetical protein
MFKMTAVKKQITISPQANAFLKKRKHISLSKIVQAALYDEARKEGITITEST